MKTAYTGDTLTVIWIPLAVILVLAAWLAWEQWTAPPPRVPIYLNGADVTPPCPPPIRECPR